MSKPQYFEFLNAAKILSGARALENVPYELGRLGVERPMIVTDPGVKGAGLLDLVRDVLAQGGVEVAAVFDRTPPDSSMATVREIAKLFREARCDGLIALGGGSPIDTAKGVNLLVSVDGDDLEPYLGADVLDVDVRPLIALPTTSGTGSEVTSVAVVADPEKGVKMAFSSERLIPAVAVLDPKLTQSMPPRVTAATGMDALAHAVEAYSCIQKNPISDAFAWKAIELIGEHLPRAVADGSDKVARLAMANGATLAGLAFSNSMVGGVHALGHAVGGVAHVPHGNAMAIFLPLLAEFNLEEVGELYGELLLPLRGVGLYARTPAARRPERFIEALRELNASLNAACGHPTGLRSFGVRREDFGEIARKAIDDPASLLNPRNITLDAALELLERAY